MPTRARVAITALAVAIAAFTLAPAANASQVSDIGAWCWFGDPRAIEWQGHTIFGWVADDGSIMVGDNTGRPFNLHPQLQRDDHNNPTFYVRNDGRLMTFWSAHGGNAMYYRTANTITDWGPARAAPANPAGDGRTYTYPNPIRVGTTLYLFWSGTESSATYATSPDDGDTWSDAHSVFEPGSHVRYIKYAADGSDIHMAWNIQHPRTLVSGIYHAIIRDGNIYRQDGTQIGQLGDPIAATAGDKIYDPSTAGGAWIHDLEVRASVPYIAYATFPTLANHTYRYAHWDGTGWADEHVVDAGPSFNPEPPEYHYSGGISLLPDDPAVAYLSRQINGQFEIERWTRNPGGWTHEPVTTDSSVINVRPYPVGGGVAWMRGTYDGYTKYHTHIEWLPNGALYPNPTQPDTPDTPSPATTPSVPASPGTIPTAKTPRPCQPALKRWRQTHRQAALRTYWRCVATHNGCRKVRAEWRSTRKTVFRTVLRHNCPYKPRPTKFRLSRS